MMSVTAAKVRPWLRQVTSWWGCSHVSQLAASCHSSALLQVPSSDCREGTHLTAGSSAHMLCLLPAAQPWRERGRLDRPACSICCVAGTDARSLLTHGGRWCPLSHKQLLSCREPDGRQASQAELTKAKQRRQRCCHHGQATALACCSSHSSHKGLARPDLCCLMLEPHSSARPPGPASPHPLTGPPTQAVLDNADLLARVMQHLGALDSTRFRVCLLLALAR